MFSMGRRKKMLKEYRDDALLMLMSALYPLKISFYTLKIL